MKNSTSSLLEMNNFKVGDIIYYYDGYVKNVRGQKIKIEIIKLIPYSKKWNCQRFKVKVLDIKQSYTDYWNKSKIGEVFEPNNTTCFKNDIEYDLHHKKVVGFWVNQAKRELLV